MSGDRVGIIGIGQSNFRSRRDDASYPDLVREAVVPAMLDAKLDFDAIDAVVYSLSPDAMVGIGNAERLGVDAVGGRNKRFLRINTGGATGISSVTAAYYHIASGVCDVVLTAGADKVGECGDSQTVLNKIWDPTYERALPLGTINMLAMSAVRYMQRYGMTEEDMAYVTVKNRRQASLNPRAHLRKVVTVDDVMESRLISWPIKLMDCCPQSSGGAAMVLASEQFIRDNKCDAVWITGVACRAETYWMGDRMGNNPTAEHADAYALGRSFEQSYRMAGITDPAKQVHIAELYAPFSNTEFHAIDAARLVAKSGDSIKRVRDGEFELGGRIPVNPSGGTLCTNAIAVTAMARVAETALQVWGRAGAHQVAGARVGIASGNGGDHQIFGTMRLRGVSNQESRMELLGRQEVWSITYDHALGETASYFFTQIRDHCKIFGKRCAKTDRVLVPPRAFSDETLLPTTEWVEVGPGGRIEAFTFVYEQFNNLPEPPYAFGYVLLDGADTALGGYFKGVDLTNPREAAEKLAIGTRVVTKFAEQRKGDVLDLWFEVA